MLEEGQPLQIDPDADSADPSLPAFLARPEGAPVYHGFVLTDPQVDGFRLGLISGTEDDAAGGDAFIVAPDGSRAGLVWDRAVDPTEVKPAQVYRYTPDRWGVWAVRVPCSMSTEDDRLANLRELVIALRPKWEEWHRLGGPKMDPGVK